jgi:trigger factor
MHLTETHNEGLTRSYRVVIAASELKTALDKKIEEIRPTLRVNGFRPGKVPVAHVRKVYGPALMQELVETQVQEASTKVLQEGALRVAGQPNVAAESDMGKVMAGEEDLALRFDLELIPEFEPTDLAAVDVERPVAAVADTQVEELVQRLVESNKTFEEKDGPAAAGDAVRIDFLGKIDGEAFDGGAAENATVVIGSNQFIPGFEDGLIGLAKGDEKAVPATFPTEYAVENLAGKIASFEVKVHEVRAPKEAVLDDAMAKSLGFEDVAALRARVRESIEREHANQSRLRAKRALFDKLETLHDFPLPPGMVKQEFDQIWAQVEQDRAAGQLDAEDKDKSEEVLRADYEKIAVRRVKLGLVLAEIGRRNKIEVSDQEVNQAIVTQARQYPGQERQVYEFFQKNPAAVASVRAPIYEEKTVDFILELAKVRNVDVDRETLFTDPDLD